MVDSIQTWVNGNAGQVIVRGGNDVEPSWSSATAAKNWTQGFDSGSTQFYLNYGSADGCSQTSSSNSSCNNGWHTYDVWYVSWGEAAAVTAPEIYYAANAHQWTMISLYGAQHQTGQVAYQGPLDEHDLDSSTLTTAQAWSDLWNDLDAYSATQQTPPFSLEVHDE